LLVTANVVPRSLILVALKMEALLSSEPWFIQEPLGVTSQKMAFSPAQKPSQKTTLFIVAAVKTSNLTGTKCVTETGL
jgi:carbohydrate-binding DOMON domain-containing protein